jgi:hypothetical protein
MVGDAYDRRIDVDGERLADTINMEADRLQERRAGGR